MKKELWAKIAYNVDKLITVDVNGRGVIRALYEHAYAKLGRPLTLAAVMSFPADPKEAKEESQRLIAKYKPAAVIAIEKGSMNEKGVIHNSRGMDTTAPMAKVDYLMQEANKSKILTVGIGDGGNEAGMGVMRGEPDGLQRFAASSGYIS